jgi:predicted HicB family RNase H-like nuclease
MSETYSGRINLRMPTDLHAQLAAEAERQGVSLNTLLLTLLAGGIGFKLDA